MWEEERTPGLFDSMTAADRLAKAHEEARDNFLEIEIDMVVELMEFSALQTLELDFSNAYCPFGCCRQTFLDAFYPSLLHPLKSIRIVGLRNQTEKDTLMTSWSLSIPMIEWANENHVKPPEASVAELYERHNVSFGDEEDLWEKWRMQ